MEENCIECNTKLVPVRADRDSEKNKSMNMKCPKANCSLYYILTEVSTYDIGRWKVRGKDEMDRIVKSEDIQV
jgi:hypothetical protein